MFLCVVFEVDGVPLMRLKKSRASSELPLRRQVRVERFTYVQGKYFILCLAPAAGRRRKRRATRGSVNIYSRMCTYRNKDRRKGKKKKKRR